MVTGISAPRIRLASEADADAIADVHARSWSSTYRSLLPAERVARGADADRRRAFWRMRLSALRPDEDVWVAELDGRILGFAHTGPARGDAYYESELYAIYVDDGARGNGVGERLLRAAADGMAARGRKSMLVWVLAGNPAERFYLSLGAQRVLRREARLPATQEIGLAWDDFSALSGPSRARA